jgi:hypothetical protein
MSASYVCTVKITQDINISVVVCTELRGQFDNSKKNILTILLGQSGEKKIDYFVFNIINCGLPHLGTHHRTLVQTIDNARGLDINSPLSAEAHT